MNVENNRSFNGQAAKFFNEQADNLEKTIGSSRVAKDVIDQYRRRVKDRMLPILSKTKDNDTLIIDGDTFDLTKRALIVLVSALHSLNQDRIKKIAKISPPFFYKLGKIPKMPIKSLEQQSAKELAKTLSLSFSSFVAKTTQNLPKRRTLVIPYVHRRVIKTAIRKFRSEWSTQDLLALAQFTKSHTFEIVFKLLVILSEEKIKALQDFKAAKKRISLSESLTA